MPISGFTASVLRSAPSPSRSDAERLDIQRCIRCRAQRARAFRRFDCGSRFGGGLARHGPGRGAALPALGRDHAAPRCAAVIDLAAMRISSFVGRTRGHCTVDGRYTPVGRAEFGVLYCFPRGRSFLALVVTSASARCADDALGLRMPEGASPASISRRNRHRTLRRSWRRACQRRCSDAAAPAARGQVRIFCGIVFLDVVHDVEPNAVHPRNGPISVPKSQLPHLVDIIRRGDATGNDIQRFAFDRGPDPVEDESGAFPTHQEGTSPYPGNVPGRSPVPPGTCCRTTSRPPRSALAACRIELSIRSWSTASTINRLAYDEEFDARIASRGAADSRCAKTSCFSSSRSGTDSITSHASATASSRRETYSARPGAHPG